MVLTKIGRSPLDVDFKNNRVTLLDTRFYFDDDGNPIPSVTTILDGAYPKGAAFFEWLKKNGQDSDEIRDEAGRKGSSVHDMTDRFDRGEEVSLLNENGNLAITMTEWNMFEKYVEFSRKVNPEHIHIEQNFISANLGIAGTVDRISIVNGKRMLIDIKTSGAIYEHYWLQLAAYAMLAMEQGIVIEGIAILWLNAKTKGEGRGGAIQGKGWQLVSADRTIGELWQTFQHVYALWKNEFGSMVPREVSYSITHKK